MNLHLNTHRVALQECAGIQLIIFGHWNFVPQISLIILLLGDPRISYMNLLIASSHRNLPGKGLQTDAQFVSELLLFI